jgi:hypothetical protein
MGYRQSKKVSNSITPIEPKQHIIQLSSTHQTCEVGVQN